MSQGEEFKSLDRSRRKQAIVDTAARIFHEKGYHSATLGDVAQALGVTKAAIYHYVPSKEELLSAIYIQSLASFFTEAHEIGRTELPVRDKLRRLVRHHIEHVILENLTMFSVFFSEQNQLPEKEFAEIREAKIKYTQVFADVLGEGMEQGRFRRADPWLRACAVLGMCNWLYKWYQPGSDAPPPGAIADHFVDLMEGGVVAPADSGPESSGRLDLLAELAGDVEGVARRLRDLAEG